MNPREIRLRLRIDDLLDEREHLRLCVESLVEERGRAERQIAKLRRDLRRDLTSAQQRPAETALAQA